AVAQPLAGAVANRHRTVSVVDIFIARSHFFEHERAQLAGATATFPLAGEIATLRIVGFEKLAERRRYRILHTPDSNYDKSSWTMRSTWILVVSRKGTSLGSLSRRIS